jgi:8-oxo-dGTP pyrophosphatase MutT (NUDIX family)
MDERHVVTCFLIHRGRDGDRLLLVRRSDRVGTYRGRWAAISGTVETTPDEQALTEILEETGLGPGQVRRLASGRPLAVEDPDLGRRWIVHPYLFAVEDPAAVRLDWEQCEARWIAPGELARFLTVPRLAAALARVYPPPGPAADAPAGSPG